MNKIQRILNYQEKRVKKLIIKLLIYWIVQLSSNFGGKGQDRGKGEVR